MNPPAALPSSAILVAAAIILIAGSVTSLAAHRLRVPDIVLFLLAGIALGPSAAGILQVPAASTLNQLVLVVGASYLLFDGGASLRLGVLRGVWPTLAGLATLGVLVTAGVVAIAAHFLLGLPPAASLLLGAALGATDPAALIPVLRQVKIRARVAQLAIGESAFNDAMAAMLTLALLGAATGGRVHIGAASVALLWDLTAGIGLGLALGTVAVLFVRVVHRQRLDLIEEYVPLVTMLVVIGAYPVASRLSASGFMAVFVAGIVVGNPPAWLQGDRTIRELSRIGDFVASTSLVMRMFIFILLGSQVNFSVLVPRAGPAALVVAVLMLVARPAAVLLCALPDRRARWSIRELALLCWTRETGVIPVALGGMIAAARIPDAALIQEVIALAVVLTIGLQAPTTGWLARRLGLLETPN